MDYLSVCDSRPPRNVELLRFDWNENKTGYAADALPTTDGANGRKKSDIYDQSIISYVKEKKNSITYWYTIYYQKRQNNVRTEHTLDVKYARMYKNIGAGKGLVWFRSKSDNSAQGQNYHTDLFEISRRLIVIFMGRNCYGPLG